MKAKRLKVLNSQWNDCTNCSLSELRTQVVFGAGNSDTRLVMLGEAPGKDEDIQGIPFVGKAGKLFNKILAAVNIKREDIWVTNTCLCRPKVDEGGRENRAPSKPEIEACRPRLQEELRILEPKIIVLAGNTPLLMATGRRGITKNRGWIVSPSNNKNDVSIYATIHPSSMFYGGEAQIKQKKLWAWEDWQEIAKAYHDN